MIGLEYSSSFIDRNNFGPRPVTVHCHSFNHLFQFDLTFTVQQIIQPYHAVTLIDGVIPISWQRNLWQLRLAWTSQGAVISWW
eukprot:COSAG04_NODE_1732_length_5768_cov_11.998236_6_plen_83_part_00